MDIKRQDDGIPKIPYWDDEIYYTLPDVIGKSKREASRELFYYNVEYSGVGDIVIDQSPMGGTYLSAGSVVRLLLGN